MPLDDKHTFTKEDLEIKFNAIIGKTIAEIDNKSILEYARQYNLQKGIVGTIIEQCVLDYPPDGEQRPDLIVLDGDKQIPTELKSTGLRISNTGGRHFIAKEPMSITAVGVYDIANQSFLTSHLWSKMEHLLIVYYYYLADKAVSPSDYAPFPITDYEFHQFSEDDINTIKQDWTIVRDFCASIVENHPGPKTSKWKREVKRDYIDKHHILRPQLSFLELVPKFPPRFRLKKPVVNTMVLNHFGASLEKLPDKYTTVSDIDKKCNELVSQYKGWTIGQLMKHFGIEGKPDKSIAEKVVIKMFGGNSTSLNQIELFQKFGLIGKTITINSQGGRTEDMKLFHIDFSEIQKTTYYEDDGTSREFQFEDSEMYEYFSANEFLCIIFQEPEAEYTNDAETGQRIRVAHPLSMNKFVGFHRLVFSDEFINEVVYKCWDDTRNKVINKTLVDVIQYRANGEPIIISCGDISSAPNFMKSKDNAVFVRGSGINSALVNKTERVNGIRMLPQYVWIKGSAVVSELEADYEL